MNGETSSFDATPDLPGWLNALSESIIGAAIEVHRALGPGLLERIYEEALLHEFSLRGHRVECQVPVVVEYKGKQLLGQRLDLIVDSAVVLELKAVDKLPDTALPQLIGYIRAGAYPLGLLVNFNVPVLWKGVYRRANSRALELPRFQSLSPSASSA